MPKTDRTPANPMNRYRVPILDRTLDLLERLSRHPEGITLTALTEVLTMPKNSAFRILTTLTLRGYVERDETTKSYRLSRKLLSVSHGAIGGQRLLQAASPVLTALRDVTGETASARHALRLAGSGAGPGRLLASREGGGGGWSCLPAAHGCASQSHACLFV